MSSHPEKDAAERSEPTALSGLATSTCSLLPCPFCGASSKDDVGLIEPERIRELQRAMSIEETEDPFFYVACGQCDCAGPRTLKRDAAVTGWNLRANATAQASPDEKS